MRAFTITALCALLSWQLGCATPKKAGPGAASSTKGTAATDDQWAAMGEVGFAKAENRPCMFHLAAEGYFSCLSAADGQCFHYGATCMPAGQCMFEVKTGTYKICTETHEGQCKASAYGKSCEPADKCMIDPPARRYRKCESAQSGACSRYGADCTPSSP